MKNMIFVGKAKCSSLPEKPEKKRKRKKEKKKKRKKEKKKKRKKKKKKFPRKSKEGKGDGCLVALFFLNMEYNYIS